MTRFLLSLDDAVDTVFAAVRQALPGETYLPKVPAARVVNIAQALIGDMPIDVKFVGVRPGEKVHEILVSEEEAHRTIEDGRYYVILPMLPELRVGRIGFATLVKEYSSAESVMSLDETIQLLKSRDLMVDGWKFSTTEMLA
jgi:UDP-glucose 4-epimerase